MHLSFSKISALFLCMTLCGSFCSAQNNVVWANNFGTNASGTGQGIVTDSIGNSYVTGYFQGVAVIGTYTLNASSGFADIFVAKYDSAGNAVWAKKAGGQANDFGYGIAIDKQGNCYVTGEISSVTSNFDSVTVSGYGQADIFIAKYDTAGKIVWAKSAGGSYDDIAYAVKTDTSGNVYITGRVSSSGCAFGSQYTSSDGIFIAKYPAINGNCSMVKTYSGLGNGGYGMDIDKDGSLYITGQFQGTIVMGTYTLVSAGQWDYFIGRFDTAGNCTWAKRAGGTGSDNGTDVQLDGHGNIIVSGYYYPNINLTCGSFTNTSSGYEMFHVKYDLNGNCQWAKRGRGGNGGWSNRVAVDADGNFYFTGWFSGTFLFESDSVTSANSNKDIFVVKYSALGNCLGAIRFGNNYDDLGNDIAIDSKGKIYITGEYKGNVQFGTFTLFGSSSTAKPFIAKLDTSNFLPTYIAEEFIHEHDAVIYPNPSNGIFTIQSTEKISTSEIMNVLGETIYKPSVTGHRSLVIDVSSQPSGIYFLQLKTEQGSTVKKIIINK